MEQRNISRVDQRQKTETKRTVSDGDLVDLRDQKLSFMRPRDSVSCNSGVDGAKLEF